MSGSQFRVEDGPLQGWYAAYRCAMWQFQPVSQTVTMQPPTLPDAAQRIGVALEITPGDPQWEVMRILGNQHRDNVHAREIRAIALGLLLPRVHALLAVRDGWEIARGSSITPAITGRIADVTDPRTSVQVSAADRHTGPGSGRRRLGGRMELDGLDATFNWVRRHVLHHPGIPAVESTASWARRTEQFLQTPLPGQPHPGQYVLHFTNAISSHGSEWKIADSVEEACVLAATHRPFNNTRIRVAKVVGVDNGMPVTERVDLGPAARPGPHRAAAAFPRPAAAVPPSAGGSKPAAGNGGAAPTRPKGTQR
jgi:hypothetical protein